MVFQSFLNRKIKFSGALLHKQVIFSRQDNCGAQLLRRLVRSLPLVFPQGCWASLAPAPCRVWTGVHHPTRVRRTPDEGSARRSARSQNTMRVEWAIFLPLPKMLVHICAWFTQVLNSACCKVANKYFMYKWVRHKIEAPNGWCFD